MITIRNKKLLLSLSVLFIAFLFTGYFLFNRTPVIESDPITTAKEGAIYTYDVEAVDHDGDTLEFSLLVHPTGMTINSTTGVITWTPTEDQVGENKVVVKVSDGSKSTTQSFTVTVEKALLTSIVVLPTSMEIEAGNSDTITSVTAHYDNGTEASIALSACTYESSKPTLITVNNGIINVSSSCTATTAIITISYTEDDVTKSDTVNVTVPAPTGGG